jgi:hypothetical protein
MTRSTAEVLLGAGTFYSAPFGEAYPAFPTTAVAGNWADPGYSEDGWNIVADLTYEYFTPAEEIDPIAVIKMAQEIHVRGLVVQFSLLNLKLAFGGGTISTDAGPPETQTYTPPLSDDFTYIAALFRTAAPESAPGASDVRDVQVPKVLSVSSLDIPHTKGANPSSVALDFRAIKTTGVDIFTAVETTNDGA